MWKFVGFFVFCMMICLCRFGILVYVVIWLIVVLVVFFMCGEFELLGLLLLRLMFVGMGISMKRFLWLVGVMFGLVVFGW